MTTASAKLFLGFPVGRDGRRKTRTPLVSTNPVKFDPVRVSRMRGTTSSSTGSNSTSSEEYAECKANWHRDGFFATWFFFSLNDEGKKEHQGGVGSGTGAGPATTSTLHRNTKAPTSPTSVASRIQQCLEQKHCIPGGALQTPVLFAYEKLLDHITHGHAANNAGIMSLSKLSFWDLATHKSLWMAISAPILLFSSNGEVGDHALGAGKKNGRGCRVEQEEDDDVLNFYSKKSGSISITRNTGSVFGLQEACFVIEQHMTNVMNEPIDNAEEEEALLSKTNNTTTLTSLAKNCISNTNNKLPSLIEGLGTLASRSATLNSTVKPTVPVVVNRLKAGLRKEAVPQQQVLNKGTGRTSDANASTSCACPTHLTTTSATSSFGSRSNRCGNNSAANDSTSCPSSDDFICFCYAWYARTAHVNSKVVYFHADGVPNDHAGLMDYWIVTQKRHNRSNKEHLCQSLALQRFCEQVLAGDTTGKNVGGFSGSSSGCSSSRYDKLLTAEFKIECILEEQSDTNDKTHPFRRHPFSHLVEAESGKVVLTAKQFYLLQRLLVSDSTEDAVDEDSNRDPGVLEVYPADVLKLIHIALEKGTASTGTQSVVTKSCSATSTAAPTTVSTCLFTEASTSLRKPKSLVHRLRSEMQTAAGKSNVASKTSTNSTKSTVIQQGGVAKNEFLTGTTSNKVDGDDHSDMGSDQSDEDEEEASEDAATPTSGNIKKASSPPPVSRAQTAFALSHSSSGASTTTSTTTGRASSRASSTAISSEQKMKQKIRQYFSMNLEFLEILRDHLKASDNPALNEVDHANFWLLHSQHVRHFPTTTLGVIPLPVNKLLEDPFQPGCSLFSSPSPTRNFLPDSPKNRRILEKGGNYNTNSGAGATGHTNTNQDSTSTSAVKYLNDARSALVFKTMGVYHSSVKLHNNSDSDANLDRSSIDFRVLCVKKKSVPKVIAHLVRVLVTKYL
ncbi:unnamed protein product [Amoebophrya sp. A120]|nr:unnamed protein product [Amoebophrya sp. A120]|eukprot:GSA120T00007466001.1